MKYLSNVYISIIIIMLITSCNSGPKVIATDAEVESTETSTGIFTEGTDVSNQPIYEPNGVKGGGDIHQVIVKEVLPTTRYVYLLVNEKGEDFWIATSKQEVQVGEAYLYREGLLKTNFQSKEHNRTFDKMYLVSSIVKADHGNDSQNNVVQKTESINAQTSTSKIVVEGSIRISDIVNNPSQYDGKTIQVSGKCTKVNLNIMGRNWIHLQDGSKNDYDFVITSDTSVPVGHTITMTGKVALNKDFGAGYKYDIILEEGKALSN